MQIAGQTSIQSQEKLLSPVWRVVDVGDQLADRMLAAAKDQEGGSNGDGYRHNCDRCSLLRGSVIGGTQVCAYAGNGRVV